MHSEAYLSPAVKHTSAGAIYCFGMTDKPGLVGDRIKSRREELGLNPVDLARASGCSISAVIQWESNKTKNLKMDNLFAIADALGVEPRWLATGKGTKLKKLEIEEADAITRMREALPAWRNYVLSLAMLRDKAKQQLYLDMLSSNLPAERVPETIGKKKP